MKASRPAAVGEMSDACLSIQHAVFCTLEFVQVRAEALHFARAKQLVKVCKRYARQLRIIARRARRRARVQLHKLYLV